MPLQADQRRKKTIFIDNSDPSSANHRWWLEPDDMVYQSVFAVCEDILLNLSVRRRMNYFFAAMYNDTGAAFAASRNVNLYYNRTALDGNAVLNSAMVINVMQNAIDTATAMIAKNKPKPQFVTDGDTSYATKVRGKKLTKYVEGIFDDMKVYAKARRMFTDACIYGTGAIKLFWEDGKLKAENLFIEELLIDDLEGMHEHPMQIHQRKYIPRDTLIGQFPKYAEEIKAAQQVSGGSATFSTADVIPVIESWHLKSAKKAKDGVHAICIENCTLFCEDYDKDYYPILFFRWAHQTLGFWGRGYCHETWKMQRNLDEISQTIQQCQRRLSGTVMAVEAGSNMVEAHLTSNKLNKIMEFTNTAPSYLTPPIVQQELYQYQQFLINMIFQVGGVSQTEGTGQKPAEVKSGVALREVADQAAGRFEIQGQDWEEIFLELARIAVDMSADEVKDNKELSTLVAGKGGANKVMFKDAIVDIEEYKLQLFPVSGLPSTPAGRLDQLMDYAQAGYLTKEQVMDIVDFPDLEDTVTLETASIHLTQQILSQIKEDGIYMPPGAYLDLPLAFRMACLEVDRSTLQKVEEDHIDLIRRWANECQSLMQQAQPQAAAMAAQPQANTGTPAQLGSAMAQSAQTQQAPPQPQMS